MNADVHALTGAYVLDAVSEHERADFERHLAVCEACAQEVRELRDTATRLGWAAAADPPAGLKGTVLARVASERQLPPQRPRPVTRLRREVPVWALRLTSAAAALLLVAATALGVLLIRERAALDDTRQQASALTTAILQAEDAKAVSGSANGALATAVVSRSQNRMLLLANGLPQLSSDKVYQAWLMDSSGPRSAGLLPSESAPSGVRLEASGIGAPTAVAVTVEPAGGSPQPTTDPIMQIPLPA
jgi:anti-sigma-K factor RskA